MEGSLKLDGQLLVCHENQGHDPELLGHKGSGASFSIAAGQTEEGTAGSLGGCLAEAAQNDGGSLGLEGA